MNAPKWMVRMVLKALVEALKHTEVTVNRHGEVSIRVKKEV